MDLDLLNMLSNLTPYGFYEPCKQMVTVHFFSTTHNKPDIIAYLLHDMSWDVREITCEEAVLLSDHEQIVVSHKPLGIQAQDSDFDKFVRNVLLAAGKQAYGEKAVLEDENRMFRVLKDNTYQGTRP